MSGEHILIVDEQPKIARRMARALTQQDDADFHVDVCTSGEQALGCLSESHVHLIIADLRIPGISGLELLEQVRQRSPHTRCILTTGFSTPQLEESARQLKVNGYLVKPFTMPDFIRAVRDALPPPPPPPKPSASEPEAEPISNAASAEALMHVQQHISHLVRDVGALGALVLDPSGQLLTECGSHGDFDTNAFLALVGNTMAAANAVAHMLGDDDAFDLHFHEGKNYSIYTARINDAVFLSLILPQGSNSRIGLVWLALRRSIADLRQLVADAEFNAAPTISNDFINALDDALDIALGPSTGFGPAEAADPLAGLMASGGFERVDSLPAPQPFERDDAPDPLDPRESIATMEPVEPKLVEPAPVTPESTAPPDLSNLFEPADTLDLSAAFGPSIIVKPPIEPATIETPSAKPVLPEPVLAPVVTEPRLPEPAPTPLMSTRPPSVEPAKAPPLTIPESLDFDAFLIDEGNIDDTPPAPPTEEPQLLSYEEAKRLGLINF